MKLVCRIFLVALIMVAAPAIAGDAVAGKNKSTICTASHGPAGVSVNPMWPNLDGQQEMNLVKQMKDFGTGTARIQSWRTWQFL